MKKLPVILVVEDDKSHREFYKKLKRKVRIIKVLALHNVKRVFDKNKNILSMIVVSVHHIKRQKPFDVLPSIEMFVNSGFTKPIVAVCIDSTYRMKMCEAGCRLSVQWKDEAAWYVLDTLKRRKVTEN